MVYVNRMTNYAIPLVGTYLNKIWRLNYNIGCLISANALNYEYHFYMYMYIVIFS